MAQKRTVNLSTFKIRQGWRVTWYSVLIWLLTFVIGGFVILPWYYLALPVLIFCITIIYFKQSQLIMVARAKSIKNARNEILTFGLWLSLTWFFAVVALTLAEIAGLYYFNFHLFFSDFRNWLLFPLVLLVPFIYSLILENHKYKRSRRVKRDLAIEDLLSLKPSQPSI